MSLQQDLENRLADDETERNDRLAAHGKGEVDTYYWGSEAPFGARGISARPRPGRSVWRQLLLTPTLIVDIVPVPAKQFLEYYGMDVHQMRKLAEKGHIIPNFYHFKNNGWLDYLRYPSIARLLAAHGRANTLWIQEYLSTRHDFEGIEEAKTKFFAKINNKLNDSEINQLLKASHGRMSWSSFATVYGQRLAYIEAIGGEDFKGAVNWIEESYEIPDLRVRAITTLNAFKNRIASETTAAFGGQYTDTEETVQDFYSSLPYLKQLVPASDLAVHEMSEISPEVHAYAQDVIRRLSKVEFPKTTRTMGGKSVKLGEKDFDQLSKLLAKLKKKNAPLGRHINNLTKEIIEVGKDLEPTLRSLKELEAEIESEFWRFRNPRSFLENLGSTAVQYSMTNPDHSYPDLSTLAWVGGMGCQALAKLIPKKPDRFEMLRLRRHPRPRRLYADWKKVEKALINPSPDNIEGR